MSRSRCGRAVSRAHNVPGAICLVIAFGIAVTGCASASGAAAPDPTAPSAPAGSAGRGAGAVAGAPGAESAWAPAGSQVRPVSLRIPAIGVNTALERLSLDRAGELIAPRDPDRAGWYSGGPAPGEVGPAVLAGHVDSRTGPAVFYRLASLRPGDRIVVSSSDGVVARFRVESVRAFRRADFPTAQVYGATPEPVLRLITCGGVYDPGNGYRDNVVAFAVPE
ncbi:MAG TPA: class F sortase [Actinomycetes bacterium]|nr:class F sortase [Actinomycetes bacterium]